MSISSSLKSFRASAIDTANAKLLAVNNFAHSAVAAALKPAGLLPDRARARFAEAGTRFMEHVRGVKDRLGIRGDAPVLVAAAGPGRPSPHGQGTTLSPRP